MDILVSSPFLAKYSQPRRVATRLLQELAALRRQLPMVRIHDPARFQFDTPDGGKSLLDLFEGRKQLTLYHFMLGPHGLGVREASIPRTMVSRSESYRY